MQFTAKEKAFGYSRAPLHQGTYTEFSLFFKKYDKDVSLR